LPSTPRTERVFLDANVLYSAAYLPDSGLLELWRRKEIELLSSSFAIAEARRNLSEDRPGALDRLARLLERVQIVGETQDLSLPKSVRLDPKDRPILLAAIAGGASHLLTGDKRHFGHLFGKAVRGVMIARPADYLRRRP